MPRKALTPMQMLQSKKHYTKEELTQRMENYPTIPQDKVIKPAYLDEEASALWDRLSPSLLASNLLNNATVDAFIILCDAWGKYITAMKQVNADGITLPTRNGRAKHPAIDIMIKFAPIIRQYCAEFYLTPASLASYAKNAPPKEEDPFDEFLP